MNNFEFENRTKVYFGKGVVAEKLPVLAARYGGKVLLGYGGGSIKKNGVYDEVTGILKDAGVEIVEFSGIMSNPTLEKMQEGARLAKEQGGYLDSGCGRRQCNGLLQIHFHCRSLRRRRVGRVLGKAGQFEFRSTAAGHDRNHAGHRQ